MTATSTTAAKHRAAMFSGAQTHHFSAGEHLVQPLEGQDYAWLIVSGLVRQYDILPNGSELTLNIYKPDSILALTWLLGESDNHFFFEAISPVTIKKIQKLHFQQYLQEHPDYALDILQKLAHGLDGMFKRLSANSYHDAEARILNEITLQGLRFGTQSPISITVLAKRTGLARETVSRTIKKLLAEQRICRTGRGLILEQPT